jgi:general secretion pathway protein K
VGQRYRERGFALVSVLWGISLMSLIASAVMTSGVLSRHMERNSWNKVQAEALVQAGINLAILGLMDSRDDVRWRIDGVPRQLGFAGATITVAIEDEFGKIDLNATNDDALRRLFRSVGLEPALADALTDRALDWRTSAGGHRLNGVSDAEYGAAGLSYVPRHGAFQSVDELKLVLGMTPEIFARVEPALTVYSQRPFFDSNVAPKEALLTLPGFDEAKVNELIATRESGPGIHVSLPMGVIDPTSSLTGRAFTIVVTVVTASVHFSEQEVVRLTGDPSRPYLVLNLL